MTKRRMRVKTGSFLPLEEQNLWEAVQEGDVDAVKSLLKERRNPNDVELDRFTTPWIDAHMLGLKEIVQEFASFNGETYTTPSNDLIKTVLYELERNMKEIFLAAECGMYDHERGVEALLKAYCLPGTITDNNGCSIIHYIASVIDVDGVPAWKSNDITNFFSNHEFYCNAVDYFGWTALHKISHHPEEAGVDVIWDGRKWKLSEAWLAVAKILVSHGCDPRIPNFKGQLPHEIAIEVGNFELAKYFEQICTELDPINSEKAIDHYHALVLAVRQGNTHQIRDFLLHHVPLLPLVAKSDLLVEAILHRQRNTLFMLLSSGIPLCNRSIGEVTPLEVAHNTLGIPACFPALIRKAHNDKLGFEIARLPNDSEEYGPLKQSMTAYNLQIMDVGNKAKWVFPMKERSERCKEAKHLLIQASELGLTLTCQLIGLEDLCLHSLSGEPNAFQRAFANKHRDTQVVLYRDLGMSPFTMNTSEEDLYWILLADLWTNEIKVLEAICRTECKLDEKNILKMILTKLRRLRYENIWSQDDKIEGTFEFLLYSLAKHGLITILHVVLNQCPDVDLDTVVDSSYCYTMLHVAAAFGKMNILEYLANRGATLNSLCLGNYTCGHIAALCGHRKCFEYIINYMIHANVDVNMQCSVGLTALDLMNKYEDCCNAHGTSVLTHEDALLIYNERDEPMKAYELLKRRGTALNINNRADLLRNAKTRQCRRADILDTEAIIEPVIQTVEKILIQSGFFGKMIPVGAFHERNEVFYAEQVDYLFEVVDPSGHEKLNFQDDENDGKITLVVESNIDSSSYVGKAFVRSFAQRLKSLLCQLESLSSKLSLVPPYLEYVPDGVCLYWVLYYKEQLRFLQTYIKPVLPVVSPFDTVSDAIPYVFKKFIDSEAGGPLHVLNILGEWTYCASVIESSIFRNLSKDQRTVWSTCYLIVRLLQSAWWAPRFTMQNRSNHWHTLSIGMKSLTESGLKTLFILELLDSEEWDKPHLFRRVISIFSRACKLDMRGKWATKEYLNSFITSKHFCCNVNESVCGVMRYLEELSEMKPQVTFALS
ncbi:hypothetical protein SK128_013134 [Halocaridina rubra]|uniref:Ankyrin repeat protein n=1 Tax=Halocaridina rubra TaxID=373956 RepID=A0AAN8XPA5_HALRR